MNKQNQKIEDLAYALTHPSAIDKELIDAVMNSKNASESSVVAKIEELIKNGANPNVYTSGCPIIIGAVMLQKLEIVRTLSLHGASVNLRDIMYGRTALMGAAIKNNAPIAKLLLEHGAHKNKRDKGGYTAMDIASKQGHKEVYEVLEGWNEERENEQQSLNIKLINKFWNAAGGDMKIAMEIRILLDRGADPNACCNEEGSPVLHMAVFRGLHCTVYNLIKGGADVNAQDSDGNTALLAAVIKRDEVMVRLLLEAGADKTIMNNKHDSPASVACGSIHKLLDKWNPEPAKRMYIQDDELEVKDHQKDTPYEFEEEDSSPDESLQEDDKRRESPEKTRILSDTTERKDEFKASPVRLSEKRKETPLRKPTTYRDTSANIKRNLRSFGSCVGGKSRNWYILWALLFPGVHNLYAGYKVRGVIQIVCIFTAIGIYVAWPWAFVEAIVMRRDGTGNEMKEGSFIKVFLLWLLGICALGMGLTALRDRDTTEASKSPSSLRNGVIDVQ